MDDLAARLGAALGDDYALGPLLGRGGMAAVYRATDRRLKREVAVKVLPPESGPSSESHARFVREAQIAAGLSHPNIVPIFDVGDRDGLVWFVMALVEGESLAEKVERDGAQVLTVVRRVLQEVGQALAYAHARAVVHRDVKPENMMLDSGSGRPMVTDFGIAATLTQQTVALTQPGTMLGTARYMAPEQLLGNAPVDGRADQYALGLVGCYLVTGTHPIIGTTLPEVIAGHVRGTAVDLAALEGKAPAPLVQALARCLKPTPEERFPRMEEFLEALREVGGELPEVPAPIRVFFRETERAFVTGSLLCFGLGLVGAANVPLSILIIAAGAFLINWVQALELARRRAVTWSQARRALYVERAGRLEEVTQLAGMQFGPLVMTVIAIWLAALAFLPSRAQIHFSTRPTDLALDFIGVSLVLMYAQGLGLTRLIRARGHGTARAPEKDWRVPVWLDFAGSLLFMRVVRHGWRIDFERDALEERPRRRSA